MTEILAGLVGGLLALAGGFGVAWLSGRQADAQRQRELTATLLAVADSVFTLAKHMQVRIQWHTTDVGLTQLLELHGRLGEVGNEFALMAGGELATDVRKFIVTAHQLVLGTGVETVDDTAWNLLASSYAASLEAIEKRVLV